MREFAKCDFRVRELDIHSMEVSFTFDRNVPFEIGPWPISGNEM